MICTDALAYIDSKSYIFVNNRQVYAIVLVKLFLGGGAKLDEQIGNETDKKIIRERVCVSKMVMKEGVW